MISPWRERRKCEGGNDKCEFLARESANLSPILARQWWRHFRLWWPLDLREGRDGKCEGGNDECEFLARESANLSPILARQWWRHFRLTTSVSLSLTDCTSRTIYRKRFRASYNRTWQNLIICLGFSITRRAARAIQERVRKKRANFFGNGKCELIANFSATMVTI